MCAVDMAGDGSCGRRSASSTSALNYTVAMVSCCHGILLGVYVHIHTHQHAYMYIARLWIKKIGREGEKKEEWEIEGGGGGGWERVWERGRDFGSEIPGFLYSLIFYRNTIYGDKVYLSRCIHGNLNLFWVSEMPVHGHV